MEWSFFFFKKNYRFYNGDPDQALVNYIDPKLDSVMQRVLIPGFTLPILNLKNLISFPNSHFTYNFKIFFEDFLINLPVMYISLDFDYFSYVYK